MKDLPVTRNFSALFLNNVPLMDVRAPVEFNKGAFPGAVNIPLLDDVQRQQIGLMYKQNGQDAAIALGNQLATPAVREARLSAWSHFIKANPDAVLYCFRGGLRSQITQQWLAANGVCVPRVTGGYKALRTFLIQVLEDFCSGSQAVVIAGKTGCGKTDLLKLLPRHIDLEGAAKHRGSAFGHTVQVQPSPIDFENIISVDILKYTADAGSGNAGNSIHRGADKTWQVFIEDESHLIGRLKLPMSLYALIRSSPIIILEEAMPARVERILRDYIVRQRQDFALQYGDSAAQRFAGFVLGNLDRIERRLGTERHRRIQAEWREALMQLESSGEVDAFRPGVEFLLSSYYDPMYEHQLQRLVRPVLFKGDAATILHWLSR
jgi:tRNA 2-selenouridine synthase